MRRLVQSARGRAAAQLMRRLAVPSPMSPCATRSAQRTGSNGRRLPELDDIAGDERRAACRRHSIPTMASRLTLGAFEVLRVIVIGLNAIFALTGLLTVILTTICYAYPFFQEFAHALNKVINVHMLVIGTLVLGVVFLSVGILGCYGAYTKNPFYLGIHIGVLLIMYMFQAIIVYAFKQEWEEKLSLGVSVGVMDYNPDDPQKRYMDGIQRVLDCCGGAAPSDYRFNNHFSKRYVPQSCCNIHNPVTRRECDDRNLPKIKIQHASQLGCRQRLHNILWPAILLVVVILGGLGFCCILFPGLYIFTLHRIHQSEEVEKDDAEVTDLDSEEEVEDKKRRKKGEEEGEEEEEEELQPRKKHRPPPLDLTEAKWVLAPTTTVWVDPGRPDSAEVAVQACRPPAGALDRLTVLAADLAHAGGADKPRNNHEVA